MSFDSPLLRPAVVPSQAGGANKVSLPWWSKYIQPSKSGEFPQDSVRNACRAIPKDIPELRVLDIGCGSGVVGLYALLKRRARFVTFADTAWNCIEEVTMNVSRHVGEGRVGRSQVSYYVGRYQNLEPVLIWQYDHLNFRPTSCSDLSENEQTAEFLAWYARRIPLGPGLAPTVVVHLWNCRDPEPLVEILDSEAFRSLTVKVLPNRELDEVERPLIQHMRGQVVVESGDARILPLTLKISPATR